LNSSGFKFVGDATVEAEAGLTVTPYVTPKLHVILYGVTGPELSIKASAPLTATLDLPTSEPCWALKGVLELEAALRAGKFGLGLPEASFTVEPFEWPLMSGC